MNKDIQGLIRSIADNDLQKAKAFVKVLLANDTAASNYNFKNSVLAKLSAPSANLLELPYELRGMLQMEDVSVSFDTSRYYLTPREECIYREISEARDVCKRLSEMRIRYVNSTLLYGESGTGKTTFGRFVANQLGVPFAYVSFAGLIGSYLGETGKNIRKVFEYIKNKPCVLMLDEIDAIGVKRGSSQEVGEIARITIDLMQEFDKIENDVTVIGATNRLDIIDEALLRRFTRTHEVKTLSNHEVEEFTRTFLSAIGQQYNACDLAPYSSFAPHKQSELENDIIRRLIASIKLNRTISLKQFDGILS